MVELVVFTLLDNQLVVAARSDGGGFSLPSTGWDGRCKLDEAAIGLADSVSRSRVLNPVFATNSVFEPPEPTGMAVSYYVCVAPSDLDLKLHIVQPNHESGLSKRQRRVVYFAKQGLLTLQSVRPLIPAMLEEGFTLTQFQEAVQAVTGEEPDKRHFRRQSQESGWLEYTGEKLMGAHRPAMRYRLSADYSDHPYGHTLRALRGNNGTNREIVDLD
ncbi:NrtR DNA-binding winged helix domain-containing protein [Devosia naphthalenivorans]|uniref:NrtR DNA-binding winged helix domain-containing protein n=1 Tax=Devosia naphthalenivorans TaxID=2082392 RepID=UPI0013B04BAA|nr:hypothetical protein [Devosia naphthalenivorans]